MKQCIICKIDKDETEFSKRYNKLQPYCKECNKEKQREHYRANKEYYKAYAGNTKWKLRQKALLFVMDYAKGGCSICGETEFCCLDFDHLDPTTKENEISHLVGSGCGIKKIKQELDKCRILCANCHRKHTAVTMGHYTNVLNYNANIKVSVQDFK